MDFITQAIAITTGRVPIPSVDLGQMSWWMVGYLLPFKVSTNTTISSPLLMAGFDSWPFISAYTCGGRILAGLVCSYVLIDVTNWFSLH